MLSRRCGPCASGVASLILGCALFWSAAPTMLSAENRAIADADDQPVAAKIPDVKALRAEPILLRYQFRPNQFLHYEVTHEMLISLNAKELLEKTKNLSVSKQHLRVVSVNDDGGAVIEPTIDHVRMKSQFDDNPPTEFDSGNPNLQPRQFEKVLESIGKPQGRQRVDARGNIVAGDDNSESMTSMSLLIPFPERGVRVGDNWNDDYSVNVRFTQKLERPIKLRRKYTLTQLDSRIATIEFKTVELDNPQDPEIRAQLIQMTPSGSLRFDVNEGQIIEKTMHSDKVEYDIAGGAMRAVSNRTEKLYTPKK